MPEEKCPRPKRDGADAGARRGLLGRRLAILAVACAVLAAVAACSKSPSGPGVAGTGNSSRTSEGAAAGGSSSDTMTKLRAYAQCMRTHGLADFPDPTANPDGSGGGFNLSGGGDLNRNSPRNQAADQACHSLLPSPSLDPAHQVEQAVKLAACMRSHGFPTFPDPDSQGAFDFGGLDTNSPQFQSAVTTCRSEAGFQGPIGVHSGSSGS